MLKERVASGCFNFDSFVEVMQNDGYITEIDAPYDAKIISSDMERTFTLQKEFDQLFLFFYPNILKDIKLECAATDKGCEIEAGGAFSYALYNENIIKREEVIEILIRENKKSGH